MDIFNFSSISPFFKEPEEEGQSNTWIAQSDITSFLEKEIRDDHIILYASLRYAYINSALIPITEFDKPTIEDLLKWDISPHSSWSEVYSSDKVWLEPPFSNAGSKLLSEGEQILFSRRFEGATTNQDYYELSQRLTQILEIHFVPERNAWCKLDRLGDIEDVVKINEVDPTR